MNTQSFDQARHYAEDRLQRELPADLLYHSLAHTRDEVVPAAERLAGMEGIQGVSLKLLLTAAWFHDIGYVVGVHFHELISARIAVQVLPSYGYTARQVEIVRWAILATALPQSPQNLLEQILTDADLDVLGRDGDFMPRNRDLRGELANLGRKFTDIEWYSNQVRFMEGHAYFTESARSLRNMQKSLNLARVRTILEELKSGK
jgi:uncharacterized protein